MSIASGPMVPTIHLNGTSRKEIEQQLEVATGAIGDAITALQRAAPNARDYYPQGDGAFTVAQDQHTARLRALQAVSDELGMIWDKVAN